MKRNYILQFNKQTTREREREREDIIELWQYYTYNYVHLYNSNHPQLKPVRVIARKLQKVYMINVLIIKSFKLFKKVIANNNVSV